MCERERGVCVCEKREYVHVSVCVRERYCPSPLQSHFFIVTLYWLLLLLIVMHRAYKITAHFASDATRNKQIRNNGCKKEQRHTSQEGFRGNYFTQVNATF